MQIILLIIAALLVIGIIMWLWDIIGTILAIIIGIIGIILYIYFYQVTIPITGIIVVCWMCKFCINKLKRRGITFGTVIKLILKLVIVALEIFLCIQDPEIGFTVLAVYICYKIVRWIFGGIYNGIKRKKTRSVKQEELEKIICFTVDRIRKIDTPERRYYNDNMPWGRATAFLNYFNASLDEEEPYYFRVICSEIWNEIREYGVIITDAGVYISVQMKDEEKKYITHNYHIPFAGLKDIKIIEGKKLQYTILTNKKKNSKRRFVTDDLWGHEAEIIEQIVRHIIEDGIPERLRIKPLDREADKNTISVNEINRTFSDSIKIAEQSEIINSQKPIWDENKRYMGGAQGHGYAAEYANNTIDRLLGKNVVNQAQQLVNGHQAKAGADRIVNGVEIQTKYCATARQTVNNYLNQVYESSDGSGKMMTLEVPREQYREVCRILKELGRTDIPVKRGYFTYKMVLVISQSGTVPSIFIDALSGMVAVRGTASVSATITFATAVWNGEDVDKAMAFSLNAGIRVFGKGAISQIITGQFTMRKRNVVYNLAESITDNIKCSNFAKTNVGKVMQLDKLTPQRTVGTTISYAMTFGPDICKLAQGKISSYQFIKNAAVIGTGSISSYVVGNKIETLIAKSLAGLAGMAGLVTGMAAGMFTSFVVKNVLDAFVEDDAVKMFRYLKEEFLDGVMQISLTEEEQKEVIGNTIGNPNLSELLQMMYMSGEYRRFAREGIVDSAIYSVISKRDNITDDMIETGLEKLIYK